MNLIPHIFSINTFSSLSRFMIISREIFHKNQSICPGYRLSLLRYGAPRSCSVHGFWVQSTSQLNLDYTKLARLSGHPRQPATDTFLMEIPSLCVHIWWWYVSSSSHDQQIPPHEHSKSARATSCKILCWKKFLRIRQSAGAHST